MALDGIFLRHIKSEIEKEALGARVSQIYQPNREELVFGLRTFSGNKKLLLSARANSPRTSVRQHPKILHNLRCSVCYCEKESAAESLWDFARTVATVFLCSISSA